MDDLVKSFKSLIKVQKITTDNAVFKLHYRFTVVMLIIFSILLTSKQYFGDPINCDVGDKDRKELIDTYCWIFGTYILKKTLKDETLPGFGIDPKYTPPWIKQINQYPNDEIIWQNYYQWVCLILFIQALLFYFPRYMWKSWEGGRLKLILEDLDGPLVKSTFDNKSKDELIRIVLSGKDSHSFYAYHYTVCEVMNLVNVVVQIWGMDWFLTGHFSFYGIAVTHALSPILPSMEAFPKLTKCKYYKFGPSGSKEIRDALCVLPLNVLNEKLFLILWFWLFFLLIVTFISLIYRVIVIFIPKIRTYLLISQIRTIKYKKANMIINGISYGDFFLLYHVGKNMNPIIYKELVLGIYDFIINRRTYKINNNEEISINEV